MNTDTDVKLFRIVVIMLFISLAIIVPWRQKIELIISSPERITRQDTVQPGIVSPPPLPEQEKESKSGSSSHRKSPLACSGDAGCQACTTCSSCKHCSKQGGTCGVCSE